MITWVVLCLNLGLCLGLGWLTGRVYHWYRSTLKARLRLNGWLRGLRRALPQLHHHLNLPRQRLTQLRHQYHQGQNKRRHLLEGWSLLVSLGQMWDRWNGKKRR